MVNKLVTEMYCPVGWGCKIHQLLLCRGVKHLQGVSWYDTKQSDGEVPVILELWGMQSTPSLPLFPGPLWPGEVAPDRVLDMGQIELKCILMLNWIIWNRTEFFLIKLFWLDWIAWNRKVSDN